LVERVLGKDEVTSSILVNGSSFSAHSFSERGAQRWSEMAIFAPGFLSAVSGRHAARALGFQAETQGFPRTRTTNGERKI
jgi:hypothetical protein